MLKSKEDKMNNTTKVTVIVLAAILALTAVGAHLSNTEFYTPNFISVIYGMASVCIFDAEYTEINSSPLILMTDTKGRSTIEDYLLSHGGYTMTEQLGASYIFENDTHVMHVSHDTKIFCMIWIIEEPEPKK